MAAQVADQLDDAQVQRLRDAVATGGRPRVRVLGSQFPEGTTGTVVRVGEPGRDGTDYIVVRIKVGSVTDELGFAPDELSSTRRGRTKPGATVAKPAAATAAPARARSQAPRRRAAPAPTAQADQLPVAVATPVRNPRSAVQADQRPGAVPPSTRSAPPRPKATAPAEAAPRGRASGGRRPTSLPTVTVTITSSGAAWSVSATRGARTVVKKAPLAPGVVTAVAQLIGRPEIHDAVEAVNGAALDEAEARAEKLRAELAEIEAVLTSHRPPR